MRYSIALLFVCCLTASTGPAFSMVQCGMRPLAPLGCSGAEAVCVCDPSGYCSWQFVCGRSGGGGAGGLNWGLLNQSQIQNGVRGMLDAYERGVENARRMQGGY